ncbi:MAG: metallo-mystery pair system four-Cys motif protein [Cyanosarcina radialis HA8281-LM2]|jgi:uncharacterized repeat protein (TIGR04052 family)|nr:metallo-mystery pair system four-Cys motif protein [Cyanosarcina radialis HA8281-LM2]
MTNLNRSLALTTLAGSAIVSLHQIWTSSSTRATAAETQAVTVRFQAKVGSQPFRCDRSYTLGKPASKVQPLDFRLYVSDVALLDAKGNAVPLKLEPDKRWQHENVALLDFEDKSGGCANGTVETNDRIVGTVPAGKYTGLKLTVGVPFELNHADATLAPSPLNLTSLWWNWQFGYKFARIDLGQQHQMGALKGDSGGHGHEGNVGFAIHLGSTGCQMAEGSQRPSSCNYPNTSTIVLKNFDPNKSVVIADLAALVANTDLSTNQPKTAPGCMSEPNDRDCSGIMSALGIPFEGISSPAQTFFRVE